MYMSDRYKFDTRLFMQWLGYIRQSTTYLILMVKFFSPTNEVEGDVIMLKCGNYGHPRPYSVTGA